MTEKVYKPYLILRVEAEFNGPDAQGLNAVCSSDYMGAAEFEYGEVPKSTNRARENIGSYLIVKIPLDKPVNMAGTGELATHVYALMPRSFLDYEGFDKTVNALVEDKLYCKEPPQFDRNFSLWRDIKNEIFFTFNLAYLQLIFSILSRPADYAQTVDKTLSIGDEIKMAVVLNGAALKHVRAMNIRTGKVASVLDRDVVMKDCGRKFRMPFAFIITHEAMVVDLSNGLI